MKQHLKVACKTLPLNNVVGGRNILPHSTALTTPPPPASPPSPHYFYLHLVLSDSTRAQMQVMIHFCFLYSASKLGKQEYLPTQFVAKCMDTSRGDTECTVEERWGGKPPCCAISTWPLCSSLSPAQVPSHVAQGWRCPAAGSASWAYVQRALLIFQPSNQVLY